MMKKFFNTLSVSFLSLFLFVSCASVPKAQVQHQNGVYWTIEGTDKSGKPSYVHILGTIHMGDDRLYPLPDEIMDDLKNSKRVAAEIGSADMASIQGKMMGIMMQSAIKAGGRNLEEELTKEELDVVINSIGMQGFAMLRLFEPWVITDTISSLQWTNSGLDSSKGIDTTLMEVLKKEGRSWEGLDSVDTQLEILQYGTYDQQLFMLKDLLADIMDPTESDKNLNLMYEAYLSGDVDRLADVLFMEETEELEELEDIEEADEAMIDFIIEYNDIVMIKRNKAWAEKIKNWLREGGETFIFAGSAHFLGDDSVFTYLRKNGVLAD